MKKSTMPDLEDQPSAFPAKLINPLAASPVLLVCEHGSNAIPEEFAGLGLDAKTRESHIAWDPGALAVSRLLSERLDAKIVTTSASRLLYDCNRPPHAGDAIPEKSEAHTIPGNAGLSLRDKEDRVNRFYRPFHDLLSAQFSGSPAPRALITIHSFEPVYLGKTREVEIGVIHDEDSRLAGVLLQKLQQQTNFRVALNDPYGPGDGVTHTLTAHGIRNAIPNVMLEIRNDLINVQAAQTRIAQQIGNALVTSLDTLGISLDPEVTHAVSC